MFDDLLKIGFSVKNRNFTSQREKERETFLECEESFMQIISDYDKKK